MSTFETRPVGAHTVPRPTAWKQVEGLELHAEYFAPRTAGDFFDAMVAGTRVAFLLSDIAGRRAQALPIAIAAQEAFRAVAVKFFEAPGTNVMDQTAMLAQEINHAMIAAAGGGAHFAPTFVGCYDVQLGVMAYINAGGQTAVLKDSDGVRLLPNVTVPLGLFTHLTFEPSIHAFEPGAKLLLVTKGVTETPGASGQFGTAGVLRALEQNAAGSAAAICQAALKAADAFKVLPWYRSFGFGKVEEDDLTALVMVRR